MFSESYREVLKQIIGKITYDYDIELVELENSVGHIHMVVKLEPKLSSSDVMQVVKSISDREFVRLHPAIKKKYFGGGKLSI